MTTAHVVPRRAFATPGAADEFLATARRWHAEARARPVVATGDEGTDLENADEPGEALAVTFTMTEQDRRAASAFYQSQRTWLQRRGLGLVLLVFTLFAVFTVYLSRGNALILMTMIPFVPIYLGVGLLWWRSRSARHPRVKDGTGTPTTIRIAPAGFAVRRGGVEELSQSWNAHLGIGSNEDFLIFPLVATADMKQVFEAHLIPRRAFETPEAADAYLRAARRWHAEATGPSRPA